jgi:hypothetical protein
MRRGERVMSAKHTLLAIALSALSLGGAAQAATLPADGQWAVFDVAFDLSGNLNWIDVNDGSALSFSFSIPAGSVGTLTVVDGGFAGDQFEVLSGASPLGTTSLPVNSYPSNVYLDFDAALADQQYSRGLFALPSGNYVISGRLALSALDDTATPLNTTVGGIRLEVSPVPEPTSLASMLLGLAAVATVMRRRAC